MGPVLSAARRQELVAGLPAEVRAIAVSMTAPAFDFRAGSGPIRAALAALEFPPHTAGVPLPTSLTPAQRAFAELLAEVPLAMVHGYALPLDTWNRRRWLGLGPLGALEQPAPTDPGIPLWRALQQAGPAGHGEVLGPLSAGERLRAYAELALGGYRLYALRAPSLAVLGGVPGLGAGHEVAPQVADFVVDVLEGPDWFRGRGDVVEDLKLAVFAALVASGHAIAPRWDRLVPMPDDDERSALVQRAIAAIPAARRTAAVVDAVGRSSIHRHEPVVLALLPTAAPDLATALIDGLRAAIDEGRVGPRAVVEQRLAALAEQHPNVRAALAEAQPAKPAAPTLELRPIARPATLPPLLRQQLQWVFDGHGEVEGLDLTELYTIHDATGLHLYDLHLFCGDDGLVHRAGTLERVASFSQGGATGSEDAQLLESLDAGYHAVRQRARPQAPS